jgi:long-subunit fatty acid transport protein
MKLKEYAAFISPVYKVNNQFSMGVTLKSVWQDFNVPHRVSIRDVDGTSIGTFTDSTFNNQYFDVDISATYKLTKALQVGLNLMNLAGTELYADAIVPGRPYAEGIPKRNLRSLGLGIVYKWQRLNVGADMLFAEDELYDASLGINYVPFNHALLSGGFAVKQQSYSLAFRLKNFRLAYINDNDLMANERRTGKSKIFNGKIYGGFIFDLN